MKFIKAEKTINVKGTAKRKAHKRVIKVTGKVKDSISFKFMSVTGLDEMDQKISHCMYDFEKRISDGTDMRIALKGLVDSSSKMYYTKIGTNDPKTDIIMNNLSKIVGDSNKGLTSDLVVNIMESGRSNYAPDVNTINVSNSKNLSERIYHEYGHHLEASKRSIHRCAVKFLDRRTEGEESIKLADLIPNIGYPDDEITKKNHFIHPYIGRQYPYNASTEIISTGIQNFVTDKQMESFYNADREHFSLCLAAISGRI